MVDVTNCNRGKVEISDRSGCVIDVGHWLLLKEGVQLEEVYYGHLITQIPTYRKAFVGFWLPLDVILTSKFPRYFTKAWRFSYMEIEKVSRARRGGDQNQRPRERTFNSWITWSG